MPRRSNKPKLSELQLRALETSMRLKVRQLTRANTCLVHKQHHSGKSTYVVPKS